jgi:hypothetical protein
MVRQQVASIPIRCRLRSREIAALAARQQEEPLAVGLPRAAGNHVIHLLDFTLLSGDTMLRRGLDTFSGSLAQENGV